MDYDIKEHVNVVKGITEIVCSRQSKLGITYNVRRQVTKQLLEMGYKTKYEIILELGQELERHISENENVNVLTRKVKEILLDKLYG